MGHRWWSRQQCLAEEAALLLEPPMEVEQPPLSEPSLEPSRGLEPPSLEPATEHPLDPSLEPAPEPAQAVEQPSL